MINKYSLLICTVFFSLLVQQLAAQPAAAKKIATQQDSKSEKKESEEKEKKEPVEEVPEEFASPRAMLNTFFKAVETEDYDLASQCLSIGFLSREALASKRNSICDKTYVLLKEAWAVDPNSLPSVDPGVLLDLSGTIDVNDSEKISGDAQRIKIVKNDQGRWVISAEAVQLIDDELFDKWVDQSEVESASLEKMSFPIWLESQVPTNWRSVTFLIKDYQWVALLIVLLAGITVDILTRLFLNFLTRFIFLRSQKQGDYKPRKGLWKPVGMLFNALTWYFGASLIDLPVGFLSALLVALKIFSVFAFTWTAFSAINLLGDFLLRNAQKNSSRYEHLLVPFIKNGLKILAVCIGLVVFVDVFSLNWNSLLGGFGLGGIAIAIASQDVLGNVFGSITVLTDRPFEIGDWVITEGVEGEVESVGMRSSRIRTFYNSLVVVPNSRLTTAIVDNMGRRNYRRVKTMVGVEYGTSPDQLEAFCEGIREVIRQNEQTRKDYFHVYVNEFGPSSINILVYFFLKSPDWAGELYEKHKILINIVKIAKELEVGFAFPTQTLHLLQDEPREVELGPIDSPRELGKRVAKEIIRDQ